MTDEERCRAEFEKYVRVKDSNYDKAETPFLWSMWQSWQACWKLCGGMK